MPDDNDISARDFGRMEGKLDAVLEHLKGIDERYGKLEGRVRKAEGKLIWVTGAAAAATFVLSKVDFTKLVAVAHAATGG
jgi:hypothetical protein